MIVTSLLIHRGYVKASLDYCNYLPNVLLSRGGSSSIVKLMKTVELTGNVKSDNTRIRDYIITKSNKLIINAIDYENMLCKLWVGCFKMSNRKSNVFFTH